jgi:hypothetical protein
MARALTGKRGILSAVIQFADALKLYAEFGEKNEIGYVEYDDEGNEVRKKVAAKTVVDNMISSFLFFTNSLFTRTEEEFGTGEPGISGRQKRRMRRMSKALTGKHGILGAVMQFAETLKTFAEFGSDNKLPIFDEEGNIKEYVSVDKIADNIVKTLSTFADILANKLEKGEAKDAGKALEKYDKMIEKLNKLSTSLTGLQRVTADIQGLANAIGDLGENLNGLNADKLNGIMEKSSSAAGRVIYTSGPTGTGGGPGTSSTFATSVPSGTKAKEPNWDEISQMIGQQVGQRVAASMKNGQFVFEFDTTKSGGVYYWQPG